MTSDLISEQLQICLSSDIRSEVSIFGWVENELNPTEWGWEVRGNILEPVYSQLPLIPPDL